jgi:hypothetical protein
MKSCCIFLFFFPNVLLLDGQSDKLSFRKEFGILYNFSSPDKIYVLPNALQEVSGITEIDSNTIACVQDEHGVLFIYDLSKEQVKNHYPFFYNGDYEGIARAGKSIYILRSDGVLFGISNYESAASKMESFPTGIPAKDNEGLCYDRKMNRILIAPKSGSGKEAENKNHRYIYSFDLKSKKLTEKPVFDFDLKVIEKFAMKHNMKVPMKDGKKGGKKEPDLELRPSAIGIHPISNKLYVLSGMERLLFVFDMAGKIEYIEKLERELFVQPEGITFLNNGDLLISNDIKNKKPTILRFNYLKK